MTDSQGQVDLSVPNTSGTRGPVPDEVKGWNWGAFFLTWVWGIGNRLWIVLGMWLLCFLAFAGVVLLAEDWAYAIWGIDVYYGKLAVIAVVWLLWRIIPAVKGNEWAWRYRKFDSIKQFTDTQRTWSRWGWIIFALNLAQALYRNVLLIPRGEWPSW